MSKTDKKIYGSVLKQSQSFRYPFRLVSNAWSSYISGPKAPKPFKLQIENTTICNLRCAMCPLKSLKRKRGKLTFGNFRYIFDQIMPCYLNLTGIGEPLLNRDIFDIISYARSEKTSVKLDTNATLLDKTNAEKMLAAEPTILSVSLDGMRKQTFEKIRRGADFDIVTRNLKNLVCLRNELKSRTKIHIFAVVQKDNITDVPAFIRFGNQIGVDSINATFVTPLGANKNREKSLDSCEPETVRRVLEGIKIAQKQTTTNLWMDNLLHYLENFGCATARPNTTGSCYVPWYSPFVTWDGNVCPCCFCVDNEVVFGNVFEEPFMKIWNNERAQAFRKNLARKREGICLTCGVEESYLDNKFRIFLKIPIIKNMTVRTFD